LEGDTAKTNTKENKNNVKKARLPDILTHSDPRSQKILL